MTADGRLITPAGAEGGQVIGQVQGGQVIVQNGGQENLQPATDLSLNDSDSSSLVD